jgi:hypothetical protein
MKLKNIIKRIADIQAALQDENTLLFSTNKNVETKQTLQTELAILLNKKRNTEFRMECERIEHSLPKFDKLSDEEIEAWVDNQTLLNYCPVFSIDMGVQVFYPETGGVYLAHIWEAKDSNFIAQALGVEITPKLAESLTKRFGYRNE